MGFTTIPRSPQRGDIYIRLGSCVLIRAIPGARHVYVFANTANKFPCLLMLRENL
jgi:hypothetical protein